MEELGMRLSRKDIMEELEKLMKAYEEVKTSDLNEDVKKIVLDTMKARIFELRTELSRIEKNINIYNGK